jgi:hypothetical protein
MRPPTNRVHRVRFFLISSATGTANCQVVNLRTSRWIANDTNPQRLRAQIPPGMVSFTPLPPARRPPFALSRLLKFLPPLAEARNCQSLLGCGFSVVMLLHRMDEGVEGMAKYPVSFVLDTAQTSFLFELTNTKYMVRLRCGVWENAVCGWLEGYPRTSHRGSLLIVTGSPEWSSISHAEPGVIGKVRRWIRMATVSR